MRLLNLYRGKTSLASKMLILCLVVSFMVPINFQLGINKVEANAGASAVWVIGDTSASSVQNMLTNTLQTTKDNIIDGVWNIAAKIFIRAMVRSIVTWISSGFQGAPTFVTDLGGFLVGVADEIAGDFIYNNEALNFLCSPFELDVRIALAATYSGTRNYQPQCTLTDVAGNVENFLDGTFQDGGWGGWVELTLSEDSNPQKAYFNATAEMYARIINEQGEEVQLLGFGDGFFSLETCDVSQVGTSEAPNCTIGTPGTILAGHIVKATNLGLDEALLADEINEGFNLIISAFIEQIITGSFGLLGLGGNTSFTNYDWDSSDPAGTNSILDASAEFDQGVSLDTSTLGASAPIAMAISTEENYLTLQNEIIGRVDAAENDYLAANTISTCSFTFPGSLEDARNAATDEVTLTTAAVDVLYTLDDAFASSSNVSEQQDVLQQFYDFQAQGFTHAQTDITNTQLFIQYDLQLQIDDLETRIANDC